MTRHKTNTTITWAEAIVEAIDRRIVSDILLNEGTSQACALLFEKGGAKSVSDASAAGLALHIANRDMFILYDPKAVIDLIKKYAKLGRDLFQYDSDELRDVIIAVIELNSKKRNRAWNANSIRIAAATGGYGPMMYDIAMSHSGRLMSDRESVSKSAKKVWKYYRDNRSDVAALELDDKDNPKTKTPVDDASLHPGGKKNPLNYAYELKHGVNYNKLITRHNKMFPKILDLAKKHRVVFTRDSLIRAAADFFDDVYN